MIQLKPMQKRKAYAPSQQIFFPDGIEKSKEVLNILGIILIIEGIRYVFGFRFRCLVDSN